MADRVRLILVACAHLATDKANTSWRKEEVRTQTRGRQYVVQSTSKIFFILFSMGEDFQTINSDALYRSLLALLALLAPFAPFGP